MLPPFQECMDERSFPFGAALHHAEIGGPLHDGNLQEEGGEKTSPVGQADGHQRFQAAVYLVGHVDKDIGPLNVEPAKNT